jgi:predicted nucleic acid-binding protein
MSGDLVLDASAALEAVLGRNRAIDVLDLIAAATTVRAPDLYTAEIGNALWKHVKAGDLDIGRAQRCLRSALDLVDSIIPSRALVEEAMVTAAEYDHPVYDALYLVAARRTGAAVCTLDRRLAALLKEARVPVKFV